MIDACYCDMGDPPSFYVKSTPRARVRHRCSECGRTISPGETYEKVSAKWDDGPTTMKTCCRCLALRVHLEAHLPCFCWNHSEFLDQARAAVEMLPAEAYGSGLLFELGRLAVAIKRAPKYTKEQPCPPTSGATPSTTL